MRSRLAAAVLAAALACAAVAAPAARATTPAPSVAISGGRFVSTATGAAIQLHGVNRSGAEYACAEGWGIFDGNTDTPAAIAALATWNINAVRLPVNEDCWLGINGILPQYSGAAYQNALIRYMNDLAAAGIVTIFNLHFSAPGTTLPDGQWPMADQDHAPAFWTSAAQALNNQVPGLTHVTQPQSIIFDLFNEPFPNAGDTDTTADWQCINFAAGQDCDGTGYGVAGMQEMLNAVRATGAAQPVLTAGPEYAGILDKWLANQVSDPLGQVGASVHIYGLPLDSPDRTTYGTDLPPVAAQVPVVVGEFGDTNCTTGFTGPFLGWAFPGHADGSNVSTVAWAWNTAGCSSGPSLIKSSYTSPVPTTYGAGVKAAYLTLPPW